MQNPTDALFTAALNLKHPWQCTRSEFSADASQLDLRLDFPPGSRFSCPECDAASLPVHDATQKQWRHCTSYSSAFRTLQRASNGVLRNVMGEKVSKCLKGAYTDRTYQKHALLPRIACAILNADEPPRTYRNCLLAGRSDAALRCKVFLESGESVVIATVRPRN